MSIFSKIGSWLKKVFTSIERDVAPIAVAITEALQQSLKDGTAGFIAKMVETIFPQVHGLPEQVVAILQKTVPKVLAAELALEGIPANPTEADILAFEQKVLGAFAIADNKSKLYTTLASQIYGDIQTYIGGPSHKFADIVAMVEQAFQQYKDDVAQIEGN